MDLPRRHRLCTALALSFAALVTREIRAATIEVYPGPGVDTYKSDL